MNDYEDDAKRKLSITDPYGGNMTIEPAKCTICGASCVVAGESCQGTVDMMSDMHLCEQHKKVKLGGTNRWYESVETDEPGPVQRELGEELSNDGGTYDGEDYTENNSEIREG